MKIGITGSDGFIGYHTHKYLKYTTEHEVIKLDRDFGKDVRLKECDWVIHLAGMNRGDENEIYETNVRLTAYLLESIRVDTKVLFASSLHAEEDNIYGASKRECEEMLKEANPLHRSIRIPNVYGPFCKPNYNSFIATFCHKLINEEDISVNDSPKINLIYVQSLCKQIVDVINGLEIEKITPDFSATVSEIYEKLSLFKEQYIDDKIIPKLKDTNDINLFNTFRSYISNRLVTMDSYSDDRGVLSETIKTLDGGQSFVSTTKLNHVRGQHFHFRKLERFCVINGKAEINLRKLGTEEVITYKVSGDKIQYIDMPILYTHNIKPVEGDITAMFWTNELLDKNDPDTFWEEV